MRDAAADQLDHVRRAAASARRTGSITRRMDALTDPRPQDAIEILAASIQLLQRSKGPTR